MQRKFWNFTVILSQMALVFSVASALAQSDPLPSWNDGATKQAIIDFVGAVTSEGGPDYVAPEDRIATFDNDGTLWVEQPMYVQLAFALDRLRALSEQHPEWKEREPFASALSGELELLEEFGDKGILQIVAATHAGMTTKQFDAIVTDWIATARHPETGKLYTSMIFQPMLEVMDYLRANEFKVFIVSGGGIAFMRPWTAQTYGVPPENIVGSSIKTQFIMRGGVPIIFRLPEIEFIDDGPGKPIAIQRFIGKQPIAAFGNSDGDLGMLGWTQYGLGRRFVALVHHDDAEREYAYDKDSHFGKLDKGLAAANNHNIPLISMKNDWKRIYPDMD